MNDKLWEEVDSDDDDTNIKFCALVRKSVEFIKAVNDHYGPERGLEVWEVMADTAGDDLKFEVFKAMMNGSASRVTTIQIHSMDQNNARVSSIKMIRAYTGWGLKEAKEAADTVMGYNTVPKEIRIPVCPRDSDTPVDAKTIHSDFHNIGAEITTM